MRGPLREERVERRHGLAQAPACGDRPRGGLGLDQRGQMGGVLDDGAGVVAAHMARHLRAAVEDAHGGRIGEQRDGAPHERVRQRVLIAVEGEVRLLARARRADQRGLERVRGHGQQHALLLGEDRGDGLVALLGMAPLVRDRVAPVRELRVEIVEVAERARGEEGVAQVLDLPLDLALFVGARRRAGPGREVIVPGELEEARMKVNRAALAIEHRALEIVVDQDPGTAAQGVDGLDVAAQKALERLVEREDRVDRARVAEHEHEARQRALAAPDADARRSCPSPPGRFRPVRSAAAGTPRSWRRRPQVPHGAPHLHRGPGIAAQAQHLVQARRPQPRILRERVAHERQDTDRASSRGTGRRG